MVNPDSDVSDGIRHCHSGQPNGRPARPRRPTCSEPHRQSTLDSLSQRELLTRFVETNGAAAHTTSTSWRAVSLRVLAKRFLSRAHVCTVQIHHCARRISNDGHHGRKGRDHFAVFKVVEAVVFT